MPPLPPTSRPPPTDIETLSEKYWGDILERTVSSNSLHLLQRTYGQQPYNTHQIKSSNSELNARRCGVTEPNKILSQISSATMDGNNGEPTVSTIQLSNSEPRLCEHHHDINCARNNKYFNGGHTIRVMPDI